MVITLTHFDPQVGCVGHGQVARVCYCDGNLVEPAGQETYPQSKLGMLTYDDTGMDTDESLSPTPGGGYRERFQLFNYGSKLTTNVFPFFLCKKLSTINKEKSCIHLPFTYFQGYHLKQNVTSKQNISPEA